MRPQVVFSIAVVAITAATTFMRWRRRGSRQEEERPQEAKVVNQPVVNKPAPPTLTPLTGALTRYIPRVDGEIIDARKEDLCHTLQFQFPECICQVVMQRVRGVARGSIAIEGPLTAFLVDFSTALVHSTRSVGGGVRPEQGDGVLLLMPDTVFHYVPRDEFHLFLISIAQQRVPLTGYNDAVLQFFWSYGIVFADDPQAAPYFLVQLNSLI